jgi:hypothetical protein
MTTRERLHQIVDEISDEQVESLLRQLEEKEESIQVRELSPELKSLFDFMDEVASNAPQED